MNNGDGLPTAVKIWAVGLIIMALAILPGCTTTKTEVVIQYRTQPFVIPEALKKDCVLPKLPARWSMQSDSTSMLNRQDRALVKCRDEKREVIDLADQHNTSIETAPE